MKIDESPVYMAQNFWDRRLMITYHWHCHIDQMIPKLNKVSFVIRLFKPPLPFEALKTVYFPTFHSIISYGIIFWGSSTYSKIIFKTQKD